MHPVGEVAVDVEGEGGVADGDVELNLRHNKREKLLHSCTAGRFDYLVLDFLPSG